MAVLLGVLGVPTARRVPHYTGTQRDNRRTGDTAECGEFPAHKRMCKCLLLLDGYESFTAHVLRASCYFDTDQDLV
jgi:hypothetical protein